MMKWMSPLRVTMQELDAKLSKIVERAREQPVAVNRYGSPWVWIVSHHAWVQADNLRALVPRGHPLVPLRDQVEDALRYERDLLADLERQHGITVGAATLFKCLMLQIIYSLEDGEKVHESLTYNMLFRWFAGFEKFADELPARAQFTPVALVPAGVGRRRFQSQSRLVACALGLGVRRARHGGAGCKAACRGALDAPPRAVREASARAGRCPASRAAAAPARRCVR